MTFCSSPWIRMMCMMVVAGALSGCSLLFSSGPEPQPTPAEVRALVPTFTATAVEQAPPAPTPEPATPAPPAAAPTLSTTAPISLPTVAVITSTTPVTVAATPTPAITARLTVTQDLINVRLGPGTDYGLAGEATSGQSFEIIGKTQAGDWWQICCVNGQEVWIFGQLASVANTEAVPVITNLPALPVAQVATPAPPAPAEPAAPAPPPVEAPPPAEEPPAEEPPPPPASDPCANIGGDGCKFRVSGGPATQPNGGTELKLQLMFKHSGDGNRPQGSYFVAMFKDGQKLPIGDGTRSLVDVRQQGTLGEYNYEYKIGLGDIPGNTVAGTYVIYVLDGNGERDSQDFTVNVPDGQGEIWIEFDQG